jgi:hypothetical protein
MEDIIDKIIRKEWDRIRERGYRQYRKEHPEVFDPDVVEAINELDREFPGVKPDESYLHQTQSREKKRNFKKMLLTGLIKFIIFAGVLAGVYFMNHAVPSDSDYLFIIIAALIFAIVPLKIFFCGPYNPYGKEE